MSEAVVETRGVGEPYQTVIKFGASGPRIHIFWRGDADPDLHDHPADFWTFPLVSYIERYWCPRERAYARRVVRAFRPHRRRAEFAHQVLGAWDGSYEWTPKGIHPGADDRAIVSLVWWGKKRRDWGFHTAAGWVPWRTYCGEAQ